MHTYIHTRWEIGIADAYTIPAAIVYSSDLYALQSLDVFLHVPNFIMCIAEMYADEVSRGT